MDPFIIGACSMCWGCRVASDGYSRQRTVSLLSDADARWHEKGEKQEDQALIVIRSTHQYRYLQQEQQLEKKRRGSHTNIRLFSTSEGGRGHASR